MEKEWHEYKVGILFGNMEEGKVKGEDKGE
jgi:hypothetical protein